MDATSKEKDFTSYKQDNYDPKTLAIVDQDGVWYKAKTVKGDTAHILVLRVMVFDKKNMGRYPHLLGQKMVVYLQGDKPKMDRFDVFYRAVESGDLEPQRRDQVDMERLSEGSMVLESLARGIDVQDLMDMKADGKDEIQNNARMQQLGMMG